MLRRNDVFICFFTAAAVVSGITALPDRPRAAEVAAEASQYDAILTVKRMCCGKESKPAIAELSKLQGVKRVVADHKARTLSIQAGEVAPSPREIWEVAEKLKIVPLQLETAEGVYKSRPRQ